MQNKFIKILIAVLLLPILYGIGIYVARAEKTNRPTCIAPVIPKRVR